jgi:hypothetical protein
MLPISRRLVSVVVAIALSFVALQGQQSVGAVFTATNPTPGTGIAGHAAPTTYDETKAMLYMFNQAPSGGASVSLSLVRLMSTAAGVGGTGARYTFSVSSGDLYASGGTAITPVNINRALSVTGGVPASSFVKMFFGAAVLSAGTGTIVANIAPRPGLIDIVNDHLDFMFGQPPFLSVYANGNPGSAGAPLVWSAALPAVVIPPQFCLKMIEWRASQSAAISNEFQIIWSER